MHSKYKYEGWGLSYGNYFFLARLIDHEETWKYSLQMEVDDVRCSWTYD